MPIMNEQNPSLEKSEDLFDYQEFSFSKVNQSSSISTEKENSSPSQFDDIVGESSAMSYDDYQSEYDGSLTSGSSRSRRDTSFNFAIECPHQTKKRYESIGLRCTGLRNSS